MPESTIGALIGMRSRADVFPERFGVLPRLLLCFVLSLASMPAFIVDPTFGMLLHFSPRRALVRPGDSPGVLFES